MNLAPLEELPHIHWQTRSELWCHLRDRLRERLEAGNRRREAVCTPEALEAWSAEVRRFFLGSLGGLPEAPAGPPPARCAGEIARPGYTIERLLLEPRPGVVMPAHFYRPHGRTGGGPAILVLCGHALKAKVAYQTLCQGFAARGFAVLVVDPVGQGERSCGTEGTPAGGTAEHDYRGLQCLPHGHHLMRYMLHDALRAVDYLCARPEVDAGAIGLTGSSGGAMQTALMMLADPRVAAAAPCSFLTEREAIFLSGISQDAEQIWPGFTAEGYDHIDLLAAFAPKPLLVLAAKYDYFPIEGTRRTVARARRFWEMHGVAGQPSLFESARVHGYGQEMIEAAAAFFARHLGLELSAPGEREEPVAEEELWCTPGGSAFLETPPSRTLFEENRDAFARKGAPEAALAFLCEAVARHREPLEPNLRITKNGELEGCAWQAGFWRGQRDLHLSGILLRPTGVKRPPLTLALWEGGTTALTRHTARVEGVLASGRALLVVNLTGVGPLAPAPFNEADLYARDGTFSCVNNELFFLGDSLAALRVYDVLQTVRTLPEWGGLEEAEPIELLLHGRPGIYGALAAALEPRLAIATWDERPPAWAELVRDPRYDGCDAKSYLLPGLLAHADWGDLLASR